MSREKGRLLLHTVLSADLDDVSRQEHGCDRTENASSAEVFREMITEPGDHMLKATVGRREQFAQAFSLPIETQRPPSTAMQ